MRQTTDKVFLVRPSVFGFNPETAESNAFQNAHVDAEDATQSALAEFDGLVETLQAAEVHTTVIQDEQGSGCLDAVFPNNWFSTHEDGTLVFYPMLSPIRRRERSNRAITAITQKWRISRLVDLTQFEAEGKFLEGTGSLVLDRVARKAFACLSPRTNSEVLTEVCRQLDYEPVAFRATDETGRDVYHTNVILSIGTKRALICWESIPSKTDRSRIVRALEEAGKEIDDVPFSAVRQFACNVLELGGNGGKPIIVASKSAVNVPALHNFAHDAQLVTVQASTIESLGGGSIRCMIAENFLRRKRIASRP